MATKKQHKTAEQLEKEEAEKAAAQRAANIKIAITACRRLNHTVRFSFIREICQAVKCEHGEAESIFAGWVKAGKIVEAWERGKVKIFKTIE